MYANINPNWNKPAIILEHSNQYSSVECLNNDSIQLTFGSQTAFNHAQKVWPAQGDFLVVSHTSSCKAENDGQRAYFDVSAVRFGDMSATLTASEVDLTQVVDDMGVAWGSYSPTENAVVHNASTTSNSTQAQKTSKWLHIVPLSADSNVILTCTSLWQCPGSHDQRFPSGRLLQQL